MGLVGLTVLMFLIASGFSAETDYPVKPVTINVGMAPGAFAGISAQIFTDGVQKYLAKPQPFVLNYKTGASAMVAADYFMKQPADGYNLMWMTPENIVAMAQNPQKFSFKKEDFSYIGLFAYSPFILVVNKESPYKTIEDFIDYAKKHPGELSYGSPGIASGVHLSTEILMMKTGIRLNHVPFTGGAPAVTALLGNHVNSYIGSTGTLSAHIKPEEGLRVLLLDAKRRELPEVLTCREKGYDVDRGPFHFWWKKERLSLC
jgi:tripartite-type tricarboxylate transporter receptor subunit TctC